MFFFRPPPTFPLAPVERRVFDVVVPQACVRHGGQLRVTYSPVAWAARVASQCSALEVHVRPRGGWRYFGEVLVERPDGTTSTLTTAPAPLELLAHGDLLAHAGLLLRPGFRLVFMLSWRGPQTWRERLGLIWLNRRACWPPRYLAKRREFGAGLLTQLQLRAPPRVQVELIFSLREFRTA